MKQIFFILLLCPLALIFIFLRPPKNKDTIPVHWESNRIQKDGIYLNWQSFVLNQPSAPIQNVRIKSLDTNYFHLPSVTKIWVKKGSSFKKIPLNKVWCICYKGKSYVNDPTRLNFIEANPDEQGAYYAKKKKTISFFRIIISGRYCIYVVEGTVSGFNTNSQANRPVLPENAVAKRKVIDLATGKTFGLSVNNVLRCIEDDPAVKQAYFDNPLIENLDKILQLYNERNAHWTIPAISR